ncbi:MAG: efflux RND transporter permease subunit, partial [Calditrichaeota bacterium]|nr:efflux RND transporter permease subunit [Calditrichota bacterium]
IVRALMASNINVPGGNITFGKTEYLIRSIGEFEAIADIENAVLRSGRSGDFVKIKDVARVNDRREELNILSRMDGNPSITYSVSKKSDANSIDVIDDIKNLVSQYRKKVPDGVDFSWSNDNSVYILRVINVLRNNAVTGMILIFVVLYLFLGRSNAFLASLGIPISFFITFILMNIFDYSLNGSSLFALVMVLGIIVDDAIIVLENCHRYRLLGYNSFESAIRGTSEVVTPILSSIGTNIAAFLPLILLPGIMGKFMRVIPFVFSLALLASMFEAFFLLPSHYADWTLKSKVYKKGEKKFFVVLRRKYSHVLFKALRRRYVLLGSLVIVLIASLGLIPLIGVELFGEEDFDQFRVLVQFPEGTSLQETDRIMQKFEQAALKLPKEDVNTVIANIGLMQGNEEWVVRKNVAQVILELVPLERRVRSVDDVLAELRTKTRDISGPVSVSFEKISGGPPVGKPISVKVQGKYLDQIKEASLALQDSIRAVSGTFDISDDFPPGKQEIRIRVDDDKAAMYGFSKQFVSMNVRSAFDGIEAGEFRDGDDEIDIIVKYASANRTSVEDVLNLKITNAAGQTVALSDMVYFDIQPGAVKISRYDQDRTIMVLGDIDEEVISLDKVNSKIESFFNPLEQRFPGIHYEIGGQFEEFLNTFEDIGALFALSMILIFLILGTQFNSYSQPLVIMATVPFAIIGAMLGLIISGNAFSIFAMYGFVALAGIVVNDAIVMIDFLNNRRSGKETSVYQHWRSIVNAGRLRLRPIILTSLTTISGLIPMAFGIGGKSDMWSPLANVILFGLLVSTILTLFIIPALLAILDDITKSRKKAVLSIEQ